MVVECKITFDDYYNGIFYAGHLLTGRVELTLDKVKTVQGLCLKICGYARVRWTENHSYHANGRKLNKTIAYIGKSDYLESINYLIGSNSGEGIEIEPGVHTYNFQCQLPPMLPSSYNDDIGQINYLATVTLERPWKFDHTYKSEFKVVKNYDLNFEAPMIRLPVILEETTSFGCFCCATGPLKVIAKIPQSGYVPGQKIAIVLEIYNQSDVKITGTKYILQQILHYHSQSPEMKIREEKKTIALGRGTEIVSKQQNKIIEKSIVVPMHTPPTSLGHSIIDMKYLVRSIVKTSGVHHSFVIDIPITIGTIKIVHNEPYVMASPFQANQINTQKSMSPNTSLQMPPLPDFTPRPINFNFMPTAPEFSDAAAAAADLPPSYEESTRVVTSGGTG